MREKFIKVLSNSIIISLFFSLTYWGISLLVIGWINRLLPVEIRKLNFIIFMKYSSIVISFIYFIHSFRLRKYRIKIGEDILTIRTSFHGMEKVIATLKSRITCLSITKDTLLRKIDILKFISPLSLIIFITGILFEGKPILEKSLVFFDLSLTFSELIIYLSIVIFLVYSLSLYNTYYHYKAINMRIAEYEEQISNVTITGN